jgi:hypothetical protein
MNEANEASDGISVIATEFVIPPRSCSSDAAIDIDADKLSAKAANEASAGDRFRETD